MCIRDSLGGVKLGAIDTGELALVAEQHATTAAHAGSVNHDGIEADHGPDAERNRDLSNGPHHGHGSDGENEVDAEAPGDEFLELLGDQALLAIGCLLYTSRCV